MFKSQLEFISWYETFNQFSVIVHCQYEGENEKLKQLVLDNGSTILCDTVKELTDSFELKYKDVAFESENDGRIWVDEIDNFFEQWEKQV